VVFADGVYARMQWRLLHVNVAEQGRQLLAEWITTDSHDTSSRS
jgi:hypothetical protein